MLGVGDPWVAYCLDSAVATFGRSLENELEDIDGRNKKEIEAKRERTLRKWLDMPAKYRNPVATKQGD